MAGDPVKTKACSGSLWQAEKGAFGPGPRALTRTHPADRLFILTALQSPRLPLFAKQQWRFRRESKAPFRSLSDVLHLGKHRPPRFSPTLSSRQLEPLLFGETCVSLALVRQTPVSGEARRGGKRRAPEIFSFFFFLKRI